mgnify:CR=1 FL=1
MPVAYKIDSQFRVVFCRAWDVLTDSDLLECQRQISEDPDFAPDMNQLFDFSDVKSVELTSSGIRTLAYRNPFGSNAKRAFSVEPGAMAMFGMMRMFEILTGEHPDELRVQFNDLKSARAWLGLPEE